MTLSPVALFSEFNLRRRPRGFRRKALKPYGPAAAAALYQQAAVGHPGHPGHPASAAAAAAADAAALGLRHYELISAAAHAAAASPTGTPMSAQVQVPFDNVRWTFIGPFLTNRPQKVFVK